MVSSVISDHDRAGFLATGKVTAESRRTKVVQSDDLWIDELWETIERLPRLGQKAEIYRGLQW